MDIINRDKKESEFAKAIAKWFKRYLPEFERFLDSQAPNMADIPPQVWELMTEDGKEATKPILTTIYFAQAEGMGVEIGVTVSPETWTLVNENALSWARNYSFELINGLNATTKTQMQTIVSDFYEQSATFKDIQDKLTELFGAARAERIAITETTRAAVQGERAYIEALEAEFGMKGVGRWNTVNDSYVCPFCAEKNGKLVSRNDEPPLHPGCRCFIDWEVTR